MCRARGRVIYGVGLLADMGETLVQDGEHVVVCQGVMDVSPVAAELDQVGLLQDAQLVRDSRLRRADGLGKVVDAELVGHQRV